MGDGPVRDEAAYRALRDAVRPRLEDTVHRVVTDLVAVLGAARELDVAVRERTSLALLTTLQDVREQLADLVHDGFVAETGAARLPARRAVPAGGAAPADQGRREPEPGRRARLAHPRPRSGSPTRRAPAWRPAPPTRRARRRSTDVRWMLQELRVSLFAQQLGTPTPVSEKRVRTALATV